MSSFSLSDEGDLDTSFVLIRRHTGRSGQLGLIMRSYRPSVTCTTPLTRSALVPDSYEFLSRHFPASKVRQVFGRVPPGQGVDVKLPWETRAPFRQPIQKAVSILVRASAARDISSWFDVYVASQAIWFMCGAHGEAGIAENIGMIFR